MKTRIESDTMGNVTIEEDKLWGPQTQRSLNNFKIGDEKMPLAIIKAIAVVKKAAAFANYDCHILSCEKRDAIAKCCDVILSDDWNQHFPLVVWQTGSGTQSNMNVNEVIAHGAAFLNPDFPTLLPNDDVNKSQSTNDVFPTAIRIASTSLIYNYLFRSLDKISDTLSGKIETFKMIKKIGRTHLMDATPLTLGDEFSAYLSQIQHSKQAIFNALTHLAELPIGGTAVGNGINTPDGYDTRAVHYINQFTNLHFTTADNKFEAMASHDSLVELSGALKRLAVSLMKIANDIRLLSSGPRCGIGELTIPANEPGSSIMPGKVNPTQCEAMTMVCCQVIGNDTAITTGALQGHLQLNVFMPLIAKNIVNSITLLADALDSFNDHCISGVEPNVKVINDNLNKSLMLVTALSPSIGYYNAAKIAQFAHEKNLTLKDAATQLHILTEQEFDKIMNENE